MNYFNNLLLKVFVFIIIYTISSHCQARFDPDGIVKNHIAQIVLIKYGHGYSFNYTIFNAQVRQALHDQKKYSLNAKIEDPYKTLKNCILFSAFKPKPDSVADNFIIGMIKDGKIIWDNFPGSDINLSDDGFYGTLLYSKDINKDGNVDLVFADYKWNSPSDLKAAITYIRILSWYGNQGRFISGKMIGSGGDELLNVNKNGILELRVKLITEDETSSLQFKTASFPFVTYGWNGFQYGLWSDVKQYSENEFLPANNFKAEVKCNINLINNKFVYSYSISNKPRSTQKIEKIYIGNAGSVISENSMKNWSAGISNASGNTIFYANYGNAGIKPGAVPAELKTTSMIPPAIVKYYLQGYTGGVTCCPTNKEKRQNILINSVSDYTLGTRDTSIKLKDRQWLDTLVSYNHHAYILGWIDDQGITDRLDKKLDNAKKKLAAGDNSAAANILNAFVNEVEAQKGKHLSSEAYALLKYNADYLISRLK